MKCEVETHGVIQFSVHFNKSAVQAISAEVFLFNQLVKLAFMAAPEAEPFVMLFCTWCSIQSGMLSAASDASSNGQVRADGLIGIPAWLPYPDPDYKFRDGNTVNGVYLGPPLAVKSWNYNTGLWSPVSGADRGSIYSRFNSLTQPAAIDYNKEITLVHINQAWLHVPPSAGYSGNFISNVMFTSTFNSQSGWYGPDMPSWNVPYGNTYVNAAWQSDDRPALGALHGKIYVVSRGSTDNDKQKYWLYCSSIENGQWALPKLFPSEGKTDAPPALITYNDTLYVIIKGLDNYLYWTTFDGQSWTVFNQNNKMRLSGAPAVAVYRNKLYCVHRGGPSAPGELWWSTFDFSNQTWSPDWKMTGHYASGNPSLTVFTEDGREKLLYMSQGGGSDTKRIWWARFEEGIGWTSPSPSGINDAANSPVVVNYSGQRAPTGPYGLTVIYPEQQ